MPEADEKKVQGGGAGEICSKIAAWALNKIADNCESGYNDEEKVLEVIASYQSSVALHRIADARGGR